MGKIVKGLFYAGCLAALIINAATSQAEDSYPSGPKMRNNRPIETAVAKKERPFHLYVGADYFFNKDVATEFKQDARESADWYQDSSITSSFSQSEKPGYGGRVGFRVPTRHRGCSMGMSAGYLQGPSNTAEIDYIYDYSWFWTATGQEKWKQDSYLTRFLFELESDFRMNNNIGYVVSLGAGYALGKVETKIGYTDTVGAVIVAEDNFSGSESWSGFTWEVSNALRFNIGNTILDLGVRYAQFPKFAGKRSDDSYMNYAVYPIDWKSFGAFATLGF